MLKNYRPISLLQICANIFENCYLNTYTIIFNQITLSLKSNQVFAQAIHLPTNKLILSMKSTNHLTTKSHSKLYFWTYPKRSTKFGTRDYYSSLNKMGSTGYLLKFLTSYLANRKQRVVLNGTTSAWGLIESGVPQGSVLGPLLFLIYISDLEKDIKSSIKSFADDTMLYSIVSDE